MFKKLLALSLILPLSLSQALANWDAFDVREEDSAKTVRAVWKGERGQVVLESAGPESLARYKSTLSALQELKGYPDLATADGKFQAQNLDRQGAGNFFHLFSVSRPSEGGEVPLGFVQFGRMPTKGYQEGIEGDPTAHHTILNTWMDLGVTELIDPYAGYGDTNIRRIENRGLAFILPLFLGEVNPEERAEVLRACVGFICRVTEGGGVLPIEGTRPYTAISLLHPADSNVGAFIRAGFGSKTDPGFGWFYPKEGVAQPRTLVVLKLEEK